MEKLLDYGMLTVVLSYPCRNCCGVRRLVTQLAALCGSFLHFHWK
jgi:hypothetical protein